MYAQPVQLIRQVGFGTIKLIVFDAGREIL
jgi:hypothetical protein